MTISKIKVEWLAIALFIIVVGVVFQQAATNMAEQGIASGGPYDNAAAYPKTVAVALGALTLVQLLFQVIRSRRLSGLDEEPVPVRELIRPAALVAIFVVYLGSLNLIGYHIATPIMLASLMALCGIRRPLEIFLPAIFVSLGLAYVFEAWLKIVLPGGFLHFNIPW